jgi:hypothetical protein
MDSPEDKLRTAKNAAQSLPTGLPTGAQLTTYPQAQQAASLNKQARQSRKWGRMLTSTNQHALMAWTYSHFRLISGLENTGPRHKM